MDQQQHRYSTKHLISPLWTAEARVRLLPAAVCAALLLLLLSTSKVHQQQPSAQRSDHDCSQQQQAFKVPGRGSSPAASSAAGSKAAASIVVVVTTKASTTDRRRWLRTQFAKNVELLRAKDPAAAATVVLRFAIGSVGLSDADRNATATEQQQHGDMLMLNIIDTNTPDPPPDGVETATALKVIHSAMWAVQRYTFPWFVRLGDDSYFRVDHFLLNVAPTLSKQKLVFGYAEDPQLGWDFSHGVSIKRYCSGMGFVMTHDVAQYINDNAPNLYKGYPEDAVVGLWLAGTNFKVQHDMRLHDWEWRRCSTESIIIHKHDYGRVDDDGVMRSCFPAPPPPQP